MEEKKLDSRAEPLQPEEPGDHAPESSPEEDSREIFDIAAQVIRFVAEMDAGYAAGGKRRD